MRSPMLAAAAAAAAVMVIPAVAPRAQDASVQASRSVEGEDTWKLVLPSQDVEGVLGKRVVSNAGEDIGRLVVEPHQAVAPLLDFTSAGLQLDQLRLTVGSPDRRSEEEEYDALLAHQRGHAARRTGLILRHADVGRLRAHDRAEVLRGRGADHSTDGQHGDCNSLQHESLLRFQVAGEITHRSRLEAAGPETVHGGVDHPLFVELLKARHGP